jgi:hypothetical protein
MNIIGLWLALSSFLSEYKPWMNAKHYRPPLPSLMALLYPFALWHEVGWNMAPAEITAVVLDLLL